MILFLFFFNFLKQRQEIQKVIMILLHYIIYKLYFFYWFKLYYTFKNYIAYLFIKYACPITTRNKTLIWKLANGSPIESKHSILRNLKIPLKNQTIKVAPYKVAPYHQYQTHYTTKQLHQYKP